jgi:hypothetical protein
MVKQRRGDAEESSDPLPEPADPLTNFDALQHGRRVRGNNRRDAAAYPYVSVISDGDILAVYPDDATIEAWNAEGWDTVTAALAKDMSELALTKAANNVGVGIRRYPKQRVSVHVTVKSIGRARPRETIGTCTVRRDGDTFFFNIAEQVLIELR